MTIEEVKNLFKNNTNIDVVFHEGNLVLEIDADDDELTVYCSGLASQLIGWKLENIEIDAGMRGQHQYTYFVCRIELTFVKA